MEQIAPVLRAYLSSHPYSNERLTWLRRRCYILLSWLWSEGVRLPPATFLSSVGLPRKRTSLALDSPAKAPLGDILAILDALRVDLDWLDSKTDVLKYVPRWGLPCPSGMAVREDAAVASRRTEALAFELCRLLGSKEGPSLHDMLSDAIQHARGCPTTRFVGEEVISLPPSERSKP